MAGGHPTDPNPGTHGIPCDASAVAWAEAEVVRIRRTLLHSRLGRGLGVAARVVPKVGVAALLFVLAARATGWFEPTVQKAAGLVPLVVVLLLFVRALRWGSLHEAALRMDKSAEVRQAGAQLALEFLSKFQKEELSPFWYIELGRLSRLSRSEPRIDLGFPGRARMGLALGLCIFPILLAFWGSRAERDPAPSLLPTAGGLASTATQKDPELERLLARLKEELRSPVGESFQEDLEQLAIELDGSALRPDEALAALGTLRAEVQSAEDDRERLRHGLSKRGARMKSTALSQPLARALKQADPEELARALSSLAERLEQERQAPSTGDLALLRKSLESARDPILELDQESLAARAKAQETERESLEREKERLLRKRAEGQRSEAESERLGRIERELRRLDRRKKSDSESALSELDRSLADAARALQQERSKDAAQSLRKGAERFSSGGARSLGDEEKRALLRRLQELTEHLRRRREQGLDPEGDAREKAFERRAQGASGEDQGAQGSAEIPVLERGSVDQARQEGGSEEGEGTASGKEAAQGAPAGLGSGARAKGVLHNPELFGDSARAPLTAKQDQVAVSPDQSAGESHTETILSAAEEGFVRRSYGKAYSQYETVAEELLRSDKVPPEHGARVRRYFQLIRPRESEP